MTHRGIRSQEKMRIRKMNEEQKQLARSIVLNFSIKDYVNGEKVFSTETEQTVLDKLKFAFGFVPQWAVDKEYGEVLNRHPVKVHPLRVRYGGFQK